MVEAEAGQIRFVVLRAEGLYYWRAGGMEDQAEWARDETAAYEEV